MSRSLKVLYEDNHLLVVDKPAGVLVQPDQSGDASLREIAAEHRRRREGKPGNAFVGIVHRLDRAVSGVVVLAKTSKAAARLSEQFRHRQVEKVYQAIVEASSTVVRRVFPVGDETVFLDRLLKDSRSNTVHVITPGSRSAEPGEPDSAAGRQAETRARRLWSRGSFHALELVPVTGRAHQLRVQCAARNMPIVGDFKYGSNRPFDRRIALHALQLTLRHPTTAESLTFRAELDWDLRFAGLGKSGKN